MKISFHRICFPFLFSGFCFLLFCFLFCSILLYSPPFPSSPYSSIIYTLESCGWRLETKQRLDLIVYREIKLFESIFPGILMMKSQSFHFSSLIASPLQPTFLFSHSCPSNGNCLETGQRIPRALNVYLILLGLSLLLWRRG